MSAKAEPLTIAELRSRHTISIVEYARVIGVSKDTAYEAAARGELRVLRIGRRIMVPTVSVLAELGVDAERPARQGS